MHIGEEAKYRRISDARIANIIVLQLVFFGVKIILVQAIPWMYEARDTLDIILLCFVGIMFLFIIKDVLTRIRVEHVFMVILISILFLISVILHEENGAYILTAISRFIYPCFTSYLVLSVISDISWISFYFNRYMKYLIGASIIASFFLYLNISELHRNYYSMSYSDITLIPTIWYMIKYHDKGRKIDLLLAVVGIILIVVFGSRNPLISIFSLIIIYGIKYIVSSVSFTKIVIVFTILVAFLYIGVNYDRILDIVITTLDNHGLYSRTVAYLRAGKITSDSGRTEIYKKILVSLNDSPFIGLGLGGPEAVLEVLPHSLYLGILAYLGYPFGILSLVVFALTIIRGWLHSSHDTRGLLLMYLIITVPRGFTGLSILDTESVWWLIGICSSLIHFRNYDKATNLCIDEASKHTSVGYS